MQCSTYFLERPAGTSLCAFCHRLVLCLGQIALYYLLSMIKFWSAFYEKNNLQVDATAHTMAKYVMELTLLEYGFAHVLPSEVS